MSRIFFLALLIIFSNGISNKALATPLLADLSNYQITMDSSFNGTRLFIFGTRSDNGDVVVVVRGPARNYIIRKKQEIAGIWMNTERMKLFNIPQFYAVIGSKQLSEMEYEQLFKQLEIGKEIFPDISSSKKKEFTDAFIKYQQQNGLYRTDTTPLSFVGETLFKTVVTFPDNIPPGNYNAEIYLIKKNTIVGAHILPIEVLKTGIDAFLYNYAHNQPVLYGISAVVIALSAGWFAGRLFERL